MALYSVLIFLSQTIKSPVLMTRKVRPQITLAEGGSWSEKTAPLFIFASYFVFNWLKFAWTMEGTTACQCQKRCLHFPFTEKLTCLPNSGSVDLLSFQIVPRFPLHSWNDLIFTQVHTLPILWSVRSILWRTWPKFSIYLIYNQYSNWTDSHNESRYLKKGETRNKESDWFDTLILENKLIKNLSDIY